MIEKKEWLIATLTLQLGYRFPEAKQALAGATPAKS
jgi:hypothetical protein